MCTIYGFFCVKLLSNHFFAIFTIFQEFLPRFTRFCVVKSCAKNCVCGEKKTNIRYDVLGYKLNYLWSDLSTSDILRYILCPAECIRYIAIYFVLPSDCDI